MGLCVLVAEDNVMQADLLGKYLRAEGYEVRLVHDGRTALDEVRRDPPDLLLLDVMMPKVNGLDVVRVLRDETAIPVLMLTARSTEDDLLHGLDAGADDYVVKPYSPRELMARVRTLLRRVQRSSAGSTSITIGDLHVDADRHEVRVRGAGVECTASELRLLHTMAASPGRVFSRSQLLGALHGLDAFITARTVDAHVMNLRKKIEVQPRKPAYLLTVHGVGYKIVDGSGA
ncbi:response regulator transcription factor [Umezawaea sp. NPDC059074]|uniref:response regulator transcription factor n=1 Tax=Umezawaea sp. NPDC059074 TaxID=3346716 RepID=UPI0036B85476